MTVNTQPLRELLAGLPLAKWSKTGSTVEIPETEDFAGKQLPITGLDKQYARRLAAYIAAANPATVSALLDEIDALRAELQARQWISVEDRLPEPGAAVMVYTPPQPEDWPDQIRIGFDHIDPESDGDVWHGHAEHYEHYCCVAKGGDVAWIGPSEKAPYTHWMPLPPAPPQGDGA